jgi:cysteine-rich repeat protein
MGEPCDDGNTRNTDACLAGCILPRCGDGFVQQGVEACDDGNTNNMDACNNSCMWTVAGFTISTTPNTPLVPTPGTGFTFTNGSADDGYQSLPIGFGFDFLGTAQTNVVISTNGFIAFSTSSATSYSNLAIPDVMPPDGFIAWWWDDLHTAVSGVVPAAQATTALTGTAPNRVRTITLLNMMRYLGGAEQLNVEIRLHETTNVIEVHYGAVTMSTSGGVVEPFGATVGWEDPTGARGADPLGCSPDCERLDWPANTIYRYTP